MGSTNEIQKLLEKRRSCKLCQGRGYKVVENSGVSVFENCSCVLEIENEIKLIESNIPKKYRTWDFRHLTAKFKKDNKEQYDYFKSYIDKLEKNIDEGKGFWVASHPGLAKSSIICYILRQAINLNKTAHYLRASTIISKKFEALDNPDIKEEIQELIDEVDILAIEEIEKVYLTGDDGLNNKMFYEFLSEIYDSDKAILISSNSTRKEVLNRFPVYIADRLNVLDYISLVGRVSGRTLHG